MMVMKRKALGLLLYDFFALLLCRSVVFLPDSASKRRVVVVVVVVLGVGGGRGIPCKLDRSHLVAFGKLNLACMAFSAMCHERKSFDGVLLLLLCSESKNPTLHY